MKILIVTDAWTPQVNGVVFTLGHTCRELAAMGHQIEVIQPGLFRSVPCPTYPEIRLSVALPGAVGRLIRQHAPHALHIATEGPLGMAARRHAIRYGLPFTTAYHTRFPEYLHMRSRLPLAVSYRWLRWFHGAAERTMAPTEGVRNDLLAHGFDPDKVMIWPRGVDLNIFRPDDSDTNEAILQSPGSGRVDTAPTSLRPVASGTAPKSDGPVFLYAGRVALEKNLDAFLSLDLPGSKWVIGGGPALTALKKRYPHAHFLGPMSHEELARHYRLADVFVFPSLTDTFGLVLLEAMACGCPVAALPAGSTRDVLGDSGAGVIHSDLRQACLQALEISRHIPLQHARKFSWQATTRIFFKHLEPIGSYSAAPQASTH